MYTDDELEMMRRDIVIASEAGADGIVSGVLRRDNTVDADAMRNLVDIARNLPVTFHRAFDHTPDLGKSLETVIDAGVQRILTSGGAAKAVDGIRGLAKLVRQAGPRLTVLAGGGVRDDNVRKIVSRSGVREVHARLIPGFAKTVAALT